MSALGRRAMTDQAGAARATPTGPRRWWRLLLVSVLLAALGVLLFGTLHAAIIAPIWRRLVGGLPFAFPAAAAMTWTWSELRRAGALRPTLGHALAFGCLLWLAVLPTTACGTIFRLTGLHRRLPTLELVLALAVAAASGALVARAWRQRLPLQLAAATLAVAMVLAMAGPVPVSNGVKPLLLWLGFLPLFVLAAVALRLADRFLRPCARWGVAVGG